MKIAQIAPLFESVPPKLYGGTERVVSYLTEELVAMGHEVTLFASGDSQTSARLVAPCSQSLRLDRNCVDRIAHHILMLERVMQEADHFDIVHSHLDYLPFSLFRRHSTPNVTTLHGRLDLPDLEGVFREFSDMPLISISNAQRNPLGWANWQGTVYHGLPMRLLKPAEGPKEYLAFLGRLSAEKRVDRAVEIARRSGVPLKIAAKIDPSDRDYFKAVAEPLLKLPAVHYVGEIGDAEKAAFLGQARALLFPIDWPEPFGIVLIEAMACGTPVIAYGKGSVPEIIDEGVTGFIVGSIEEAVEAVGRLHTLDRTQIRTVFEKRFVARRMASDYVSIYNRVIEARSETKGSATTLASFSSTASAV